VGYNKPALERRVRVFTPNFPVYDTAYSMHSLAVRTGADPNLTGRGVVMAFIDSGFYPHPDLGDRVLCHVDATSNRIVEGRRFHDAEDYAWHGQMTSVIAAGDGKLSNGLYRGLASRASLVLIKVSTRKFQIKEIDILRGLTWLLANHRRFNVKVVNISVGGDFPSADQLHPLHRAVRELTTAGVTVLVAAGNSGANSLVPPASAPEAITVGGYDDRNTLDVTEWQAYHNNFSIVYDGTPKPDVTAPAAWIPSPIMPQTRVWTEAKALAAMLRMTDEAEIRAALLSHHHDLLIVPSFARQPTAETFALLQERIHKYKLINAYYQHVDGTSVSTAVASSVVAQMLEAAPQLTPAQVKQILIDTAHPLEGIPSAQQGAGRIDPLAAVQRAVTQHTTADQTRS